MPRAAPLGLPKAGHVWTLSLPCRGAPPNQARAEPRLRSPFPRTRPAPSSCHLTLGRPPKSRSSRAAGGAGWGPPAAGPGLKRRGRLRPPAPPPGRPGREGWGPRRRPGSSGSARPAAALPRPPRRAPRKRRPTGTEPGPEALAPPSPPLTAIVRPGHAQPVDLLRGGHGGGVQVSAEEAARP